MQSTSTSETILSVENLNLVFNADLYRAWTWRDAFTKVVNDPVGTLLAEKDHWHILKDISFKLRRGERLGIIGVNGIGKTTLCRCIAGIYHPTRGKINLTGKPQYVFDTTVGIFPELTGRENARLLMEFMYPDAPHEHDAMLTDALEFSELGKFLDVPYRLYSNGMQARLCLSLISCRPGDLLILDEVFDGADSFFRAKISERILAMIRSSGAAIFVSHAPEQVERVCNRLIVLEAGTIAYDGDVAGGLNFYYRHQNATVK
jgi:ABC-type polysaccharide/polyol phosphate transport system ATPase subunit